MPIWGERSMLDVKDIDVFYGDLQALWGISLDVKEAEIVSLVGSNGGGKSTILRTIAGLQKPSGGAVQFRGQRTERLAPHEIVKLGVCLVPEGRRIFPHMSILENLEVGAYTSKARNQRDVTLSWLYTLFPILALRSRQLAGTLSGGEQQMLAIGRALMSKPVLLLIDEMSLGLSPLVVKELSRVVRDLNQTTALTVLLVEQNVRLALNLSHRTYILENGHVVDHGDARELSKSDRVKKAYLGAEPGKVRG
jgi:branched-chain amino acid transport system ATP-binding protein